MLTSRTGRRTRREIPINMRAAAGQCALIDRAAALLGKNRSRFMLDAACREAESILIDQRLFQLDVAAYKRFVAELDRPPAENARLRSLLRTKAPWE